MQGLWTRVVSLAIMGRTSLLAGILLATATQAMSEPYVLICKVQRLQNMPHWELIDRIFVDELTQRIDFVAPRRSAPTRRCLSPSATDQVMMRFGFPAAICVEPPIVRVIAMRIDGYEEAVFACTRQGFGQAFPKILRLLTVFKRIGGEGQGVLPLSSGPAESGHNDGNRSPGPFVVYGSGCWGR